jgi:hypothetical protein
MEVLTAPEQAAPEQAPQLTTDEAMNLAFGTSSEEDEAEEVGEEEANGGSLGWGSIGWESAAQLQVLVFS